MNAEEGERLKRIAEREKQFYNKRADGSGWAALGEGADAGEPDASPPRRGRQRHDSPDASPPRRQRHDSPDASPPRRQRHDSPDASPPRRRAAAGDASPPRRQRLDSPDASPPRRRGAAADASPPRRQRHDSPDASPPRRQRPDSPDASPPRRRAASPDASPPRPQAGSDDASPPRRQRGAADADASPPRKRRGEEADGSGEETAEAKRRRMMSDGTVAGMVSGAGAGRRACRGGLFAATNVLHAACKATCSWPHAALFKLALTLHSIVVLVSLIPAGKEVMEEMKRKRERERQRFAELDADVTGRGAQTVRGRIAPAVASGNASIANCCSSSV